ncbi:MAG: AAA family ATPase [Clostridia bacterium]|nr:AAA family ATPase [Clostridia bacterium]
MTEMKILSISITEFGGLKDFSMDFSGGFNIIRGDNEAGKSTVLLFITYMLYGLVRKSSKNNDKDKSLSWSGARAEGSMEIEHGGRKYRIERANVRRSLSSEAVITELDTGKRIETQEEVGVFFLGLSREAFESCVWCGQTRVSSINGAGVSETLSNLSLTADESVNGEAVLKVIREARKQYRYERGNGGLIYDAEQARADAELDAAALQKKADELVGLKIKSIELGERVEQAKDKMNRAKDIRKAAATVRVLLRIGELKKLKESIEEDKRALEALKDSSDFGGIEPDEKALAELNFLDGTLTKRTEEYNACLNTAKQTFEADVRAADVARKISERESAEAFCARIGEKLGNAAKKKLFGIASVVVTLILAAVGIVLPLLFAAAGAFAVLAALMLVMASKESGETEKELHSLGTDKSGYEAFIGHCFEQLDIYEREKNRVEGAKEKESAAQAAMTLAKNEIEQRLERYGRTGGSFIERLSELTGDIEEYLEKKKSLNDRINRNSGIAEREEKLLSEYDEEALRGSLPSGISGNEYINESEAELDAERASAEYDKANAEFTEVKAKILSQKDCEEELADIQRNIDEYTDKIGEYNERFAELDLAYSAVKEAYDNMKSNFAPKVRESAGEYLGAISDGKYSKVLLSEAMEVSVDASGKQREAANLSGGTADAVYISLRLALIGQIFQGTVPFFMDETLSQLDDTRACGVLELIDKFVSEGNQCLLFSCHQREAALCDTMGIKYNKIEMSG